MEKLKNKYIIIGIALALLVTIGIVLIVVASFGKSGIKEANSKLTSAKTSAINAKETTVTAKATTVIATEATTAQPKATTSKKVTKASAVITTAAKTTAAPANTKPSINLVCKNSIPFTAPDYGHRGITFTITDVHLANLEISDDCKQLVYQCYITAQRGYDGLGDNAGVYLNINLYDAAGNFIDHHGTYPVWCREGEKQTRHPDGALSSEKAFESGTYYYELVPEIRPY